VLFFGWHFLIQSPGAQCVPREAYRCWAGD